MEEKNYFWEEPDFVSEFQRGEMFSNDDCEDNDEEYEMREEKFRVIVFLQDVETGKCLKGWDEGFTKESYSRSFVEFLEKMSERYPYLGC